MLRKARALMRALAAVIEPGRSRSLGEHNPSSTMRDWRRVRREMDPLELGSERKVET